MRCVENKKGQDRPSRVFHFGFKMHSSLLSITPSKVLCRETERGKGGEALAEAQLREMSDGRGTDYQFSIRGEGLKMHIKSQRMTAMRKLPRERRSSVPHHARKSRHPSATVSSSA